MQDRPTYNQLLEAVQRFLESDVVPALEGPKKFHARVAANVLAIVRRELESEDTHLRSEWEGLDRLLGNAPMPTERKVLRNALKRRVEELCERIRAGDADALPWRAAVIQHTRQTVIDKLSVANPKYVGTETSREL